MQYPAILTKQAWSIKDSVFSIENTIFVGHSAQSRVNKIDKIAKIDSLKSQFAFYVRTVSSDIPTKLSN